MTLPSVSRLAIATLALAPAALDARAVGELRGYWRRDRYGNASTRVETTDLGIGLALARVGVAVYF